MKKVKNTLLVAIIALFAFTQTANAQKNAHINVAEVVASLPEMVTIKADIEKLAKTYEVDLQKMEIDLKAKTEKFKVESQSRTPQENEQVYQQLQQEAATLQKFEYEARQDLAKKENEKMLPVQQKVVDAIKAYAAEKGIEYIFDSRTLIHAGGKDISADIKAKLGVK